MKESGNSLFWLLMIIGYIIVFPFLVLAEICKLSK